MKKVATMGGFVKLLTLNKPKSMTFTLREDGFTYDAEIVVPITVNDKIIDGTFKTITGFPSDIEILADDTDENKVCWSIEIPEEKNTEETEPVNNENGEQT